VKVRIGFGLGVRTKLHDEGFATVVDALERLRFDSLWLSERIGGEAPDPLVGMAFAAGRTTRLKFGMSVMVLPGRNRVVLPKEQATFDVARTERGAWFDESMAVLRACWSGQPVTHHGARYHYDDLRVLPVPTQAHLDVWLGGIAPSELRRVARLSDGWLPSFVTPDDAARGRETIEAGLAEHGRTIDPEHFGALIPYVAPGDEVPEAVLAGLAKRRPDLADPSVLVPQGWDALLALVDRFVAVGTSKFVVLPLVEPASPDAWVAHLEDAAPALIARQT